MLVSPISPSIPAFTPSSNRLAERSVSEANSTSITATTGETNSSNKSSDPATEKTGSTEDTKNSKSNKSDKSDKSNKNGSGGANVQLSDEALAQLAKLKARDLEVRQHEAAHLAVAGALATSGPSFTFQKGPDGVNYAIGGEVGIDVAPGRTPQETIARARIVQAAALAPAEPSGPDLAIAQQAQQLEQQARTQLAVQSAKESVSGTKSAGADTPASDGAGKNSANGPEADRNRQQNLLEERRNNLNRAYGVGGTGGAGKSASASSFSVFA